MFHDRWIDDTETDYCEQVKRNAMVVDLTEMEHVFINDWSHE